MECICSIKVLLWVVFFLMGQVRIDGPKLNKQKFA